MPDVNENPKGVAKFEAGMPSLSDLHGSLRSKRDLGKLIGVHRTPDDPGRQIVDAFVAHVDWSMRDYNDIRTTMIRFLSLGYADDEYLAADRFDACINSLHKAVSLIEKLRGKGYQRADGSPLVPKPREMTVLLDISKKKIRDFRDAAEHLDDDILKGKVPPNHRIGVHLSWTNTSITSNVLSYAEVSKWIRQLYVIADDLSAVRLKVV